MKKVLQSPSRISNKTSGYQNQLLEVPDSHHCWCCFASSVLSLPCHIRLFFCVEEEGRTYSAKSFKIAKANLNVSLLLQEKKYIQFSLPIS